MINVSAYPFCAKRLAFQYANLSDPAFTSYWAAVSIAEDFSDEKLAEYGGFNFDNRSEANGYFLLGRLEKFIRSTVSSVKAAKSDKGGMSEAEVSVRAFLGANGVKVSKLNGVMDYWTAAMTLWPVHITPTQKNQDVHTLRFQINKIPKKARGRLARKNAEGLPVTWRAVQ
jgi:hypothetical protein